MKEAEKDITKTKTKNRYKYKAKSQRNNSEQACNLKRPGCRMLSVVSLHEMTDEKKIRRQTTRGQVSFEGRKRKSRIDSIDMMGKSNPENKCAITTKQLTCKLSQASAGALLLIVLVLSLEAPSANCEAKEFDWSDLGVSLAQAKAPAASNLRILVSPQRRMTKK